MITDPTTADMKGIIIVEPGQEVSPEHRVNLVD